MAQEQTTPFEQAADLSLAAFKTGIDFWTRWPLFLASVGTQTEKVDEIEPAPVTPAAIRIAAQTIAPPPIEPDVAPVIVTPAVVPMRPTASSWKPKEPKKKLKAKRR